MSEVFNDYRFWVGLFAGVFKKSSSKKEEPEAVDELLNATKGGAGHIALRPTLYLAFSRMGRSPSFLYFISRGRSHEQT